MNLLDKREHLKEDLQRENQKLDLTEACIRAAYKKLEEEIKIRKQSIEDSYKPTKQKIFNSMEKTNLELEKVNQAISELNTFDVHELAPILADLISEHELEKYSYQSITADVKKIYAESWGYETKTDIYYISCIAPDNQKNNYVIQEVMQNDNKILNFDNRITVLSLSNTNGNQEIKTLSLNGPIIASIIAKYPYLSEFIDYVIETRCSEQSSKKDLTSIYKDYLILLNSRDKQRVRK